MAKKPIHIDALIFIDTNILLDFYRIRKTEISLKYLQEIEKNKNRLILNNQVEMEFRKNRQKVIMESLDQVKKVNAGDVIIPAIIYDSQLVGVIQNCQKKNKRAIFQD